MPNKPAEQFLQEKGLRFRRRGNRAELQVCPFCNGGDHNDRWTCVVYLDDGNYKCQRGSCAVAGTFWGLVEQLGGNPHEYYQKRETTVTPKTFKREKVEPKPLTDEAIKYLHKRGFNDETLESVSVWSDEKGCINFGYYHESELCLVKVRNARKAQDGEPKAWQKWSGGLRTLWGLEDCDPEISSLVITFGEYDRMAVMQAGLANVVSVPCGDQDLEWMTVCFDALKRFEVVTLWIDNDESGRKCLPQIAERLGRERVRVVRVDHKDPNEMLLYRTKAVGAEAAHAEMWEAVADAEWYWKGDVIEVADIVQAEQCFDGYMTSLKFLDRTLGGFYFHRLTVHMGDTKHGKSEAVNQTSCAAMYQDARVCVWTGEDSPDDFKYKIQVHLAGESGIEIRTSSKSGREYSYVSPEVKAKIDEYLRGKMYLLDKRSGVNEDVILENFELAYKRYGCDVFIIDNLMKAVASKDTQNVYFRQAQIVNKFSDFVKSYRVHGHLVVHTNKTGSASEPPKRETVSGAKEIINLADNVVSWWRVPDEMKIDHGGADAICSVLANRVHGEEGSCRLRYDIRTRRFTEMV